MTKPILWVDLVSTLRSETLIASDSERSKESFNQQKGKPSFQMEHLESQLGSWEHEPIQMTPKRISSNLRKAEP